MVTFQFTSYTKTSAIRNTDPENQMGLGLFVIPISHCPAPHAPSLWPLVVTPCVFILWEVTSVWRLLDLTEALSLDLVRVLGHENRRESVTESRADIGGPWSITSPRSHVEARKSAPAGLWEWSSDLGQMSPIQLYSGTTSLDLQNWNSSSI